MGLIVQRALEIQREPRRTQGKKMKDRGKCVSRLNGEDTLGTNGGIPNRLKINGYALGLIEDKREKQ